ncbi:MAG: M4 family metallopeptidase [Ignavibacteria bacterium]|nr:M4 family metallopeptidase [Ignavibacteria bacterium]
MSTAISVSFSRCILLIVPLVVFSVPRSLHAQLDPNVTEICNIVHPSGWVRFKDNVNISGKRVFEVYGPLFGLTSTDEMRLLRVTQDRYGYTHYRYKQYHDGVPIQDAMFIVHEKNGRAVKANGRIVISLGLSGWPNLTRQQALERAIRAVPHGTPAFLDRAEELFVKRILNDTTVTQYPEPELAFVRVNDNQDVVGSNLVLAYLIPIATVRPIGQYNMFVDAINGSIVKAVRNSTGCTNPKANANTLFNGEQIINVKLVGSDYILEDYCNATYIQTRSIDAHILTNPTQTEISHADLEWTDDNALNPYVQAHWSAMMTYEYFHKEQKYDGYDNNGSPMLQLLGGRSQFNWYNNYQCIVVPDPEEYPDVFIDWGTALDVIGHEWTHAISYEVADIPTSGPVGEFGALFESFGDIFGSMVECYAKGLYDQSNQYDCEDYIMGEECLTTANQRNMVNPNAKQHPDTYCGTYWSTIQEEDPGYHIRAGVQNRWFTLLAKSGTHTGTNNHCCSTATYSVTGIGKEKAAKVAFRNLSDYLGPWSNFVDARIGSLEAANDLVLNSELTSGDVTQIKEAWKAVGVYANNVGYDFVRCATYTSQSTETLLEAIHRITAGKVCGNANENIVQSGATLSYIAGDRVRLKNGFRARDGCSFRASIADPCTDFFPRVPIVVSNGSAGQELGAVSPELASSAPTLFVAPNPVQDEGVLWFSLRNAESVRFVLCDQLGRVHRVLIENVNYPSGVHRLQIELDQTPAGLYICVLSTGSHTVSTVLQVVR